MAKKSKNKRTTRPKKNARKTELAPKTSIWDRQTPLTRHSLCILALVAVSFMLFAPIHFEGKTLFAYDTVSFKAMANEMIEYEEETGEEALWSPNPFGGMPGYMISTPLEVAQIDDLPRALRQVIWPSSHFIFLLAGMYLLAFYLVNNHWASLLASLAYGLTTYVPIILVAGHNSKFITMAFAPWLILAFVFALRRPGLLSSSLFAIALAANLRAGHVQITYYVAFVLAVWWLVEVVSAIREGRSRDIVLRTAWLGLGSILGVLMVAQPYLSNFEYKAYTIRGAAPGGEPSGLAWDYAMRWSQGVGELLTLLISDAYGGASAYWGPKPPTGGPHYVGGVGLLLAVYAAVTVRRREVLALSIAVFLMVLFSLGRHFELLNRFMYEYFPLFSSFRVPETWLSIVALALALMAAFGVQQAVGEAEKNAASFPPFLRGTAVALGVVLVFFVMRDVFFDFEKEGEVLRFAQQIAQQNNVASNNPQVIDAAERFAIQLKEDRAERYNNDAIRTLLFLLGAGLAFSLYQRKRIPAFVAGLAFVGLVGFDLGQVWTRYFNEERLGTERTVDDLVAEYPFDRYLIDKKEELGGNGHFRVLSLEGNPTEVARPAYHYETLSGYHGAKLRLYQDYLDNILFDPSGLPNENGMDLLNTRYVVAGGPYPGAREVFRDERTGMIVSERVGAPERAFFVGELEVIESAQDTWARLQDASFDPSRTAILAGEVDGRTTPLDSTSMARAELNGHTPHTVSWDLETDADRLLVVSEIYYPAGWNAYLDGEEIPIHRVNYLLRGVFIPEGSHELVMRFEPRSYELGYWLTLASTILVYGSVVVLLGAGWVRRKRSITAPNEEDA